MHSSRVGALIDSHRERLTPAERRVAQLVLDEPETVAFGTVAEVAAKSATSGATVVRLAARLGLDGFTALQALVQAELADRLRPATERIRQRPAADVVGRAADIEGENVADSLASVDRDAFDIVVGLLASPRRKVLVLAGEASRGIGLQMADELAMLRPGVSLLVGTDVRLGRSLAELEEGDVLLVIDLRRYERWVIATTRQARLAGAFVVALSDSALSPLAELADATFVVRAAGVGPFDSHVGTVSVGNALVAAVAARLRSSATTRLDKIEAAWAASGALLEP